MVKLIHGADFHLDAPFHALPPEKAAQRRAEQRELLFRLADLANREEADLLLLSGDLFDGAEIYGETLDALSQALGSVRGQVFIAPGNHDFWSARSPYAALVWPENVHIFTEPEIETVGFARAGLHGPRRGLHRPPPDRPGPGGLPCPVGRQPPSAGPPLRRHSRQPLRPHYRGGTWPAASTMPLWAISTPGSVPAECGGDVLGLPRLSRRPRL